MIRDRKMKKRNFIILLVGLVFILFITRLPNKKDNKNLDIVIYNNTDQSLENLFLKLSSNTKLIPVDRIRKSSKEKISLELDDAIDKEAIFIYYSDKNKNEHRKLIADDIKDYLDSSLSIYIEKMIDDGILDIKSDK